VNVSLRIPNNTRLFCYTWCGEHVILLLVLKKLFSCSRYFFCFLLEKLFSGYFHISAEYEWYVRYF